MLPALTLLAERGGAPWRLNSWWMEELQSMTSRRVAMLSLSYRKRVLILFLNISAYCTILLDMRVTMPCRLEKAPNYLLYWCSLK